MALQLVKNKKILFAITLEAVHFNPLKQLANYLDGIYLN